MMLTRRTFLGSAAAIAIAPAVPPTAVAPAAQAAAPATTIWVGGHTGEFDWQPINAATRNDAIRELIASWEGIPEGDVSEEDLAKHDLCLERAENMDGLEVDQIKGHHWIDAGLGCSCDRCGVECYAPDGARAIECEAICSDCLTIADKLADDPRDAEEDLIEVFALNDCDEEAVREVLSRDIDVDVIPADMWAKCLSKAKLELSPVSREET